MRATYTSNMDLVSLIFLRHSSISDVHPCHILALIETSTFEEASALKSVISNHLRFQSGISATVSVSIRLPRILIYMLTLLTRQEAFLRSSWKLIFLAYC